MGSMPQAIARQEMSLLNMGGREKIPHHRIQGRISLPFCGKVPRDDEIPF
jgi:hypothetical protein